MQQREADLKKEIDLQTAVAGSYEKDLDRLAVRCLGFRKTITRGLPILKQG